MSFVQMLTEVRALSRIDKLRLIQIFAEDLAHAEESSPLAAGQTYPSWSPDRAYDAAAIVLHANRFWQILRRRQCRHRAGQTNPMRLRGECPRNARWRVGVVLTDFRECQNPLTHPTPVKHRRLFNSPL